MAFGAPTCPPNIIDILAHQPSGVYTKEMLKNPKFRQNWWFTRPNRIPYPNGMGPNPLRRIAATQRGGEIFPFRPWRPSNGTGSAADNIAAGQPIGTAANAACCPPVVPYNRGYANKGLNQFDLGRASRLYCAKDFTQSLDPSGDLALEFQGYVAQNEQTLATFNRNEFIRLCTNKVYSTPGNGIGNRVTRSTQGDPNQMLAAAAWDAFIRGVNPTATDPRTGVTGAANSLALYLGLDTTIKPTSTLTQDLLVKQGQFLSNSGIDGIKTMNGAPVYEVVTSETSADALLRDASNLVPFEYADMGKGDQSRLLGGLGQALMFRGFTYIQDSYAPRFDLSYNYVPATITQATDNGFEDVANPAWFTAPIEISILYTDVVYDLCFPNVAANPGGNIAFDQYNYMGDIKFVKADTTVAPLGNMGYFYSEFFVGSWANRQRYAAIIVHLNCNAGKFQDCNGVITTY